MVWAVIYDKNIAIGGNCHTLWSSQDTRAESGHNSAVHIKDDDSVIFVIGHDENVNVPLINTFRTESDAGGTK